MNAENARVAEAIRAFKDGEIVVVTDDDDRENEGDLILAASHATPSGGIVLAMLRHAFDPRTTHGGFMSNMRKRNSFAT